MPRGLDHIVHAVRDLDAAADLYRRLGFHVGARNKHPWGTHNQIVQLPGFFIELLTVAEPSKLGNDGLSTLFGRFNQEFLARHEGLSLLILESMDAQADAAAFRKSGIAASDAMRFEREGKRPDGSNVKLAFSLAFARDPLAPACGFATCQHHFPENFWNPALQDHPNTALSITSIIMVAENPTDHHIFLSAYTGERELHATSNGVRVTTPRGSIEIMNPEAYRIQFELDPPDITRGARLAAMAFVVSDVDALEARLEEHGIPTRAKFDRVIVPQDAAMGATILFQQQ